MRLLVAIGILCCFLMPVFAQQERPGLGVADHGGADTTGINLLLSKAGDLIFKAGELPADLAIAQPLLDSATARSERLKFLSGQERAFKLQVQYSVEALDGRRMRRLLPKLSPAVRCDLLRRFTLQSRITWQIDSALTYARMMKEEALRNNMADVANDAEYYLSVCYDAMGQTQKQKECYMNMVRYHQKTGNQNNELMAWDFMNLYLNDLDTTFPTKAYVQEQLSLLSQRLNNKLVYARTLGDIGKSHLAFGRWKEAEHTLLMADDLLKKLGVKERYGIYDALSYLYTVKLNLEKAIFYANAIRDNRPESASSDYKYTYHLAMANVYVNFGRNQDFYNETFKLLENRDAATERSLDYIVLFARRIDRDKGPKAALAYLLPRMSDKNTFSTPGQHIFANMMLGDFYIRTHQPEMGIQHYRTAESLMDPGQIGRSNTAGDLYIRLAKEWFNLRKYDSSLKYLQRMEVLPKGLVTIRVQEEMHNLFCRIDSIQGRYRSALQHFKQEKALSDSVFNINKWGQMAELQLKYETARKDQELKQSAQEISWLTSQAALREALFKQTGLANRQRELLKDKDVAQAQREVRQREDSLKNKEERILLLNNESQLQQGLLQQTRTTRNVIILAAVLLLGLLLVIYNRYLLKQRNNRELEKQKALISHKNESLGKLLREKEWLLKEVHHRVKNNLQVVMSLLNIQSFYLQDDNAISAIRDSQRRVNAISLIHKKLYQSDNPALVDMPLYICELADYLREYADGRGNIKIELDIAAISLDVRKALPIGLILNESITNAFKYAFPGDGAGVISVSLILAEKEQLVLQIADNGVGLRQSEEGAVQSLGMSLMNGLAKDMDGELIVECKQGTVIRVLFPLAMPENVEESVSAHG